MDVAKRINRLLIVLVNHLLILLVEKLPTTYFVDFEDITTWIICDAWWNALPIKMKKTATPS